MLDLAKSILLEENGQGTAEYVLFLVLVALGLGMALYLIREGISNTYQRTASSSN